MKKMICLLLSAIILFPGIVYSSDISDETSHKLSIVKNRIGSTEQYDNFNSNIQKNGNKTVYRFSWENIKEKNYLDVNINKENIITFYYNSLGRSYEKYTPTINKLSYSDVKDNAEEIFARLNPDIKNSVEVTSPDYENLHSTTYTFNLQRVENGIKVAGNSGQIEIAEDGKTLISLNYTHTPELKFEHSELINKDTAISMYKEKVGVKLVYERDHQADGTIKMKLVYIPKDKPNTYISAETGDVITAVNCEYAYRTGNLTMDSAKQESSYDNSIFTEVEREEIREIEGLFSVDEIDNKIKSGKYLSIPEGCGIGRTSLVKRNDNYVYDIYYSNDETNSYCNVEVNAANGEILNFNMYEPYDSTVEILSDDEALNLANESVNYLADKYIGKSSDDTYKAVDSDGYTLRLHRFVNGVECIHNHISVEVNKSTGKITNYYIVYDDVDFPDPEEVISETEIYNNMFEDFVYEKLYIPTKNESDATCAFATPVYCFTDYYSRNYDPFTGEALFPQDSGKIIEYTDVCGHYAENAINTLRKYGIGYEGGKFEPDAIITKSQFEILTNAIFNYASTPLIFKNEIVNTTDENESNDPLTRAQACAMLIEEMGYSEVAKLDNIYISPFADVKEFVGHISILKEMGVVSGNGMGEFHPEDFLTKGEAAVMLYNYLNR